jgi:hypothetical protein
VKDINLLLKLYYDATFRLGEFLKEKAATLGTNAKRGFVNSPRERLIAP